jgi:hypothetical protein
LAQREASIDITHEGSTIKLDLGRCFEEITFVPDQDTMFNRIMEKVTSLGLTIDTFYLETRLKEIIRDYNFTHVPEEEETGQTLDDDEQIQQICKLIAPWRGNRRRYNSSKWYLFLPSWIRILANFEYLTNPKYV